VDGGFLGRDGGRGECGAHFPHLLGQAATRKRRRLRENAGGSGVWARGARLIPEHGVFGVSAREEEGEEVPEFVGGQGVDEAGGHLGDGDLFDGGDVGLVGDDGRGLDVGV